MQFSPQNFYSTNDFELTKISKATRVWPAVLFNFPVRGVVTTCAYFCSKLYTVGEKRHVQQSRDLGLLRLFCSGV